MSKLEKNQLQWMSSAATPIAFALSALILLYSHSTNAASSDDFRSYLHTPMNFMSTIRSNLNDMLDRLGTAGPAGMIALDYALLGCFVLLGLEMVNYVVTRSGCKYRYFSSFFALFFSVGELFVDNSHPFESCRFVQTGHESK